jgi:hypothetical protein
VPRVIATDFDAVLGGGLVIVRFGNQRKAIVKIDLVESRLIAAAARNANRVGKEDSEEPFVA